MTKKMNIAFVGAGNVAFHLAPALVKAGHEVVAVWSRTNKNAVELCSRLPSRVKAHEDLDFTRFSPDVLILSLSDDAYETVLNALVCPSETLILHTSGSQPMEILAQKAVRVGVFYPLQTFSKAKKVDFSKVLFCLEAKEKSDLKLLEQLTTNLGANYEFLDSFQRQQLHLSAVFACNFANLIWQVAEELLTQHQLDFKLLEPLLRETLDKALVLRPSASQTGPAARNDQDLMQKHRELLAAQPQYQELYEKLSEMIQVRMKK